MKNCILFPPLGGNKIMKNSTKAWGLIGAAAIIAPLTLSAPALADGGRTGPESKSAAFRTSVSAMAVDTEINASSTLERLLAWNEVMLDANALDHTATSGFAGDQQGPTRNSRAFAIIQIAVFDAVNAFNKKFEPFSPGLSQAKSGASKDAAIAYAAYTSLVALYPRQKTRFDALLASDLSQIPGTAKSIADGRVIGLAAANAILRAREDDGAGPAGTSTVTDFGNGVGMTATGPLNVYGEQVNGNFTAPPRWAPDRGPADDNVAPLRNAALGSTWGAVDPFVLTSGAQFRIPAYPAPGTRRFRAAYNDVLTNGGEDIAGVVGTDNTAAKQFIGNFWGYDGAPLLGTPPRLYNQIAIVVANAQGLKDVDEYARLLALVNVTMGDSGIAAWDSKYFYNYWRPGNGIRDGGSDGDAATAGLDTWRPFGASVINGEVPERFTPPFPAYPSGHATFGAAMAQSLTSVFGNNVRFTFVSDEYNGEGIDPKAEEGEELRPLVPVRYRSLLAAQLENGRSRVFNGVHWEPDDTEGQNLGTSIVRYTLTQKFRRR
jgi:PAP2 superfamily/Vanadium chloroperoxidase N-terminal domain